MALSIGDFNALQIVRNSEFGVYLDGGEQEVLLPNKYVPPGAHVGETLDVFIYHDSEDRLVATTAQPHALVGDVVPLEVVDVSEHGAFLDWGLDKDLFVPFREQAWRLRVGDDAVVLVMLDERSGRLIGTMRLEQHLSRSPEGFVPGQPVKALVSNITPLGYTVALDAESLGFIYEDQTPEPLRVGEAKAGWVQRVREDGRVDVTLHAPSRLARADDAERIFEQLKEAGGFLVFHDGSDPADIERVFGISKKAFKRALATLYRERRILIGDEGIRIAPPAATAPSAVSAPAAANAPGARSPAAKSSPARSAPPRSGGRRPEPRGRPGGSRPPSRGPR